MLRDWDRNNGLFQFAPFTGAVEWAEVGSYRHVRLIRFSARHVSILRSCRHVPHGQTCFDSLEYSLGLHCGGAASIPSFFQALP